MVAGSRFLTTMGIPIVLGRDIEDRDTSNAPRIAVVNQTFAREYLGGRNPLGRIFYFGQPKNPRTLDAIEIVGVCGDAKYDNLKHEIPPTAYIPYLQNPDWVRQMTFEIRTALAPMTVAGVVRRAVAEIDPKVPVAAMRTQEEQLRQSLSMERLFATLVGSFGLVAALLAAIGIYGVMAYAVTRRTAEIGIRMALGAGRGDVQRMMLRESLLMVAIGMIAGIPAALAVTGFLREILYGIAPTDPVSFVAAGILMLTVAAVAAWLPARRAALVDPMRALRNE
jgi:predicted permease